MTLSDDQRTTYRDVYFSDGDIILTVRAGLASGVASAVLVGQTAQVALLAALAGTVGLAGPGWLIGIAYGVAANGALIGAFRRAGTNALGPADRVTLLRAILVGGVTALVADSFNRPAAVPTMVALATAALVLDAVDGWIARRTRTASAVGARFDMEVDAFLVLVLSIYDIRLIGAWVLAIGAARYLFVAAGWVLPWLQAPAPPRYWNKVVAAIQGTVLTVTMADLLPRTMTIAAALVALVLLAESFGRQVWWLRRHRPVPVPSTQDGAPVDEPTRRRMARRVTAGVTTALAFVLVWFALVAPSDVSRLAAGAFVRIPIEALVVLGLFLVLPARWGRPLVILTGTALGLVTVAKVLDMGFLAALDRPFNPLSDWYYIGPLITFLGHSIGRPGAVAAGIAAAAMVLALAVLVPLSVRRLTLLAARNRAAASRFVGAFGAIWLVCAVIGLQLAQGSPMASDAAARFAYDSVSRIRAGITDQDAFEAAIALDPAGFSPAESLLTGLRGKDVLLIFFESYGRFAVQDPAISPGVDAVLDAGTRRLANAGFSSRSAFLTSPTFGAVSWLAHATLQSGLWVDSQRRHDQLLASDRFTLSAAFRRAGWRTVLDAPADNRDWPEGQRFYRFDQVYDNRNVGYRGPNFNFGAAPPDQYTLSAFRRAELADPRHAPVMAQINLMTSHAPWTPLPRLVEPSAVGDGSIYSPMPQQSPTAEELWADPTQVKAAYGQSIEYTLNSIISFVETYGDDDLVVLVVGDHQPLTIVSGANADHDVPITLIARDSAVIDRITPWQWQDGMNPGPNAPVLRMDGFRDKFLETFRS